MELIIKPLAGKSITTKKSYSGLLNFLSMLVFFLCLGTTMGQSKSQLDCTPGFLFCDYYKCIQRPFCPAPCEGISNEFECRNTAGESKCKWDGIVCRRDATCDSNSSNCSSDCMLCGAFKCIPKGSSCPKSCEQYGEENQCKSAPTIGSINCVWSDGRCSPNDKSKASTTIESKKSEPTSSSKSSNSKNSSKDATKTDDTSSSTKSTLKTPTPTPTDDEQVGNIATSSSNSGAIGIGVGVSFGLLGLLGIALLLWHRRKERIKAQGNEYSSRSQNTLYRPQSLLRAVQTVVNDNQREFNAAEPLSPLSPAVART